MELITFVYLIFSIILGIVIGSFLNVLIFRLPLGMSVVKPSSHCFNCGKKIKWYDNIPILSYLILKGKCRYCHQKISPQYLIIEVLTGILFGLFYLKYRLSLVTILMMIIGSCLIVIFMIDLKHYIIPDSMVITILSIGIISIFIKSYPISFLDRMIGFVIVLVFWFLTFILGKIFHKDLIGMGDLKLLGAISMVLGYLYLLISLFIGAILALIIEVIIKQKRQKLIPFGPYLVGGFLICMLVGGKIVALYKMFFLI